MPESSPEMDAEETAKEDSPPALWSSLASVFVHADAVDVALMVLGLVGAVGDGLSMPVTLLFFIRITNDLGRGPEAVQDFSSRINTVRYTVTITWKLMRKI